MGKGRFNFPAAMSKQNTEKHVHLIEGWAFSSKNYIIFIVGVLLIFLGYVGLPGLTINTPSLSSTISKWVSPNTTMSSESLKQNEMCRVKDSA